MIPTASTPQNAAPARALKTVRLGDLAIAPENLRFAEPPDPEIPQLAAAIRAAGVLLPLTVRPGRRREHPAMVLDGRRRLLALQSLMAAGEIAEDHPVPVFEETDPSRQAAAAVLTNTAAPVHVADIALAVGKMLKARLTPAAIAAALGCAEIDVRRLAAVADLHPKGLEALKTGRITLRQARLLARLADREAQGEIAAAVLQGFGFQEWRVTERLENGRITVADRRFALVGAAGYAAGGGRTEADLFGEQPDVLLDPELLQALWSARADALVQGLAVDGRTLVVTVEPGIGLDPALVVFGHAYGRGLDPAARDAWRAAQAFADAAAAALAETELADSAQDAAISGFLAARLAADQASEPGRAVTHLEVFASRRSGLDVRCYGPPQAEVPEPSAAAALGEVDGRASPVSRPLATAAEPEIAGIGHALHAVRTDYATRALIRALADAPEAALAALTARLFSTIVLDRGVAKGESALSVRAAAYGRPAQPPVEALDGEVRRRLADRSAAWAASGRTVLAWIAGLPHAETLALLAELAALSLDLREERTTGLRLAARAEAVEIAALCGGDLARYWTPDEAFLRAHAKPQLMEMLQAMGAGGRRDATLRKDELVARVAEEAARRRWTPAALWPAAAAEDPPSSGPPDEAEAGPTGLAA
jgi:ParB family chromosome partitioning protein